MPSSTITQTISGIGGNITQSRQLSAEGSIDIDQAIADAEVDKSIAFVLDISEVAMIAIKSTQAITIETNDGTTPADTLSLAANVPLVFSGAAGETNPFTTDITELFVTNASGAEAQLQIKVLFDPTP